MDNVPWDSLACLDKIIGSNASTLFYQQAGCDVARDLGVTELLYATCLSQFHASMPARGWDLYDATIRQSDWNGLLLPVLKRQSPGSGIALPRSRSKSDAVQALFVSLSCPFPAYPRLSAVCCKAGKAVTGRLLQGLSQSRKELLKVNRNCCTAGLHQPDLSYNRAIQFVVYRMASNGRDEARVSGTNSKSIQGLCLLQRP